MLLCLGLCQDTDALLELHGPAVGYIGTCSSPDRTWIFDCLLYSKREGKFEVAIPIKKAKDLDSEKKWLSLEPELYTVYITSRNH